MLKYISEPPLFYFSQMGLNEYLSVFFLTEVQVSILMLSYRM